MTARLPFHEQLRHERELRGWSQADLAEKVRCDTKTVGRWESGDRIPRPYHRQSLCEVFGKNAEELGLVKEKAAQPPLLKEAPEGDRLSPSLHREGWDEVPSVVNLYGRDEECAERACWIEDQHCHIVAVLGMGGVGKTAVATKVAAHMKPVFDHVFWRSLQNAPPIEIFLRQCISFVSDQQLLDLPGEIDDQVSLLIHSLRDRRCLLVLDNFESVLQPGRRAGHFREGYAAYGRLLQRVGEAQHQSCLLLTSREGNPLALQVVSQSIQEVFEGHIGRFLQEDVMAFGDINDLLDQQFHRLSNQERECMYWLAIEREPASLEDLRENLVYPLSIGVQLEALDSLRRRSLIETRGLAQFTLQPVIMEYITRSLMKRACEEFLTEAPEVWRDFALCKAQAKDYVRESQVRLLLEPVAQSLLARLGKEGLEQRVRDMLARQRRKHPQQPGYLAGNILNLLSYVHADLRGFDFSHLVVRQAYLQA